MPYITRLSYPTNIHHKKCKPGGYNGITRAFICANTSRKHLPKFAEGPGSAEDGKTVQPRRGSPSTASSRLQSGSPSCSPRLVPSPEGAVHLPGHLLGVLCATARGRDVGTGVQPLNSWGQSLQVPHCWSCCSSLEDGKNKKSSPAFVLNSDQLLTSPVPPPCFLQFLPTQSTLLAPSFQFSDVANTNIPVPSVTDHLSCRLSSEK